MANKARNPELAARFLDFLLNEPDAGQTLGLERGMAINLDVRAAVKPTLKAVEMRSFDDIESIADISGDYPPQVPLGAAELAERVYRTVADQLAFGQITPLEAGVALVAEAGAILG